MAAGSATGSGARPTSARVIARLLSAVAIVALLAIPATTLAAKGGGSTGTPAWIALNTVNVSGASVQPSLGSWVTFSTAYPSSVKNPRVEVRCYQSNSLVYGEAGAPVDTFVLGGGGSIWLTNGGAASCTANLFYFGSHAGSQTYNLLASTNFTAGG
jgi:hypothetical protein